MSGHDHEKSPKKKYCFDCARRGFVLRKKGAMCDSAEEDLASGKTCTLAQCAKLCQQKDGCLYFAFGRESQKGHCVWQKTTNACTDVGEKFKASEHDFFSVCKKANDASAEFQCQKDPHQITAGECGEGPGHGKHEGAGQRKHEGLGQRKHEGKQKAKHHDQKKTDASSDDSDDSSDGSTDDNADTKKKSEDYSQYYKKPDGSNADTDTGDSKVSSGKDQEPGESSAGSAALAISGVILGICVIGGVVIFAIRRYNSAKYEKSGGTSAMGHVYGYGGNSKGDSYRDSEDDDDEEISLKFADHPSDGSSAENED